jgi:hypothetical protein
MDEWYTRGCEYCRFQAAGGGGQLPTLLQAIKWHAVLRQCPKCNALWIENQREMHVIDKFEAAQEFPGFSISD